MAGRIRAGRNAWYEALQAARDRVAVAQRQCPLKSAPWKVAVAAHLKATTDVSNRWLAAELDMGSHVYVSKHVGNLRLGRAPAAAELLRALEVKGKA